MSGELLLRQLEYLVALARERHFARAAATCFVSQPALSSGIRKLEVELEVTIVQRGRRFRGLTSEGQLVLGWANRILAERDGLRADLEQMRGGLTSTLRLGTIPTAVPITTLIAERFSRLHPLARVRVEEMSSHEISRRLTDFQIDVGVTYLDHESSTSTDTVELYREQYFLVCPAASALAERDVVDWSDAASLQLCLLSQSMRNRRLIDGLFASDGAIVTPVVETDSMGSLYAHVASRRLSTVASQAWLYAFGVPEGMCVRMLVERRPREPIGLVLLGTDPSSIVARACRAAVHGLDVERELSGSVRRFLTSPSPGAQG
jgi:DNA-binding transcriptional LysR family regulator